MEINLKDKKEKLTGSLLMTALFDALNAVAKDGSSKTTIDMGFVEIGKRKGMISIVVDTTHELLPKE